MRSRTGAPHVPVVYMALKTFAENRSFSQANKARRPPNGYGRRHPPSLHRSRQSYDEGVPPERLQRREAVTFCLAVFSDAGDVASHKQERITSTGASVTTKEGCQVVPSLLLDLLIYTKMKRFTPKSKKALIPKKAPNVKNCTQPAGQASL